MDEELLFKKLSKRIQAKPDDIKRIIAIVNKYDLNLNIRNFDSHGVIFRDEQGKTVRILNGVVRNGFIHTKNPNADVAIIFIEDLVAGWIESSKMEDLDDRMSINVKSLHVMPDSFVFKQQCPHLDVYGGFYEGEYWECIGCGERLVFSDN